MTDAASYIQKLADTHPLREPLLPSMIRTLRLPQGSRGLDAGCGIGQPALLLAEAIGPAGHVTGLDISPAGLRYAERVVKEAGFSGRISFREGDVGKIPFDDRAFDWAWSADCVGYPVGDLLPVLRELARVVKPGGTVVILGWTSQCVLPGYPLLEARLNATCSVLEPYVTGRAPESNFLRALGFFAEAGLRKAESRTFVGEVRAPLSGEIRRAMICVFDMLWGERRPGASDEDWAEYRRLCRPESPDCIFDLPDYYAFFTYTMFRGKVPE
jgi:demethylmenaquinone methyltransferase/2-methoxy-6-polyprenyl-1,4-benzoquinol methylase